MKKICLIGDSIRMGYQQYVTDMFQKEIDEEKVAVIYDKLDNGRFVQYELWQLNQLYKDKGPFDVVFFNSGYWDMNREMPNGDPFNPLPIYLEGLKRIVEFVRSTNAIPIFVNSAPIYNRGESKDNTGTNVSISYRSSWVVEYNDASQKLMDELGVEIVDIYSMLLSGDKYYKQMDMLHLTYEGYEKCANLIVKKAKELLGL